MNTMTLGLFHTQEDVENALNELSQKGFPSKDISLIMKNKEVAKEVSKSTGAHVAGGIATGVTTGGVIGGITGLLVGIGAVIIPGIGPLLIAGPLAVALGLTGTAASTVSGALTGAVAGGLLGGLIGLGLPEEEARVYETDIKAGGILIAIPTTDVSESTIQQILRNNKAEQIRSITNSKSKVLV